jgi:primosomal protein N'
VLKERMELHLPPFSLLLELSGASEALHQLRDHLLEDSLFVDSSNEIYPVHHGKMTIKVLADDRTELLNLLQSLTRVRSAKRLPIISYRVIDEDR